MRNTRTLKCIYSLLCIFCIGFGAFAFRSDAAEKYMINRIITEYQKEIYLEEKLPLAELQKNFPDVIEVGIDGSEEGRTITVGWTCTKDYDVIEEDEYLFSLQLPENYELNEKNQVDADIKVIVVNDQSQKDDIQQQSENDVEQNLEGEGSEENPYKLCSVSDFKQITADATAFYELQNDINVDGRWDSIGSASSPFQGTLDGKGYTIKGIKYEKAGAFHGIFMETKEAVIKNLAVETTIDYVSGQSTERYVGGIVNSGSGTIKSCVVRATLYGNYNSSGDYVNIGLLAGKFTGTIEECYGEGKIATLGSEPRGGSLVGSFSGMMVNCYANVSLNLPNSVSYRGGFIGIAHGCFLSRVFPQKNRQNSSLSSGEFLRLIAELMLSVAHTAFPIFPSLFFSARPISACSIR